jgi:succinylarginine dihydrolase
LAWLKAITLLLSLADTIATYLKNAQLMDAGEAKRLLKCIKEADESIKRARTARSNVKHDADSVRNDADNTD